MAHIGMPIGVKVRVYAQDILGKCIPIHWMLWKSQRQYWSDRVRFIILREEAWHPQGVPLRSLQASFRQYKCSGSGSAPARLHAHILRTPGLIRHAYPRSRLWYNIFYYILYNPKTGAQA